MLPVLALFTPSPVVLPVLVLFTPSPAVVLLAFSPLLVLFVLWFEFVAESPCTSAALLPLPLLDPLPPLDEPPPELPPEPPEPFFAAD